MERFHLSKERVGSMFSQSEHSKLTNYIQQLRMEYAAKMLVEQPAKSIVLIAQECGFSSHKYFTERFRQYYNMTPLNFEQHNNKRYEKVFYSRILPLGNDACHFL